MIDDLEDGEYTFEATVNATSVLAAKEGVGKILYEEDNYNNNTAIFRLRFKGNKTPVVLSSNQVKLLSS